MRVRVLRRVSVIVTSPGVRRTKPDIDEVAVPWVCVQAFSTDLVKCWSCCSIHRWVDRRRWNGTYSYCPVCSGDVTSYPW